MIKAYPYYYPLLIMFALPLFSAEIYDVPVQEFIYSTVKDHGFDRIVADNSIFFSTPGSPELPAITYNYLLPAGQKLKDIELLAVEWEKLPDRYYLFPKQKDLWIEEERDFKKPDPAVYNTSDPYPPECIIAGRSGTLRGYQIGQVAVAPFQYIPAERTLYRLKSLRIKINTVPSIPILYPRRQTSLADDIMQRLLSSLITNRPAIDDLSRKPPLRIDNNNEDMYVTGLPSLLGAPVDLLIITTDQQLSYYQQYARHKKLSGYNTAVRSISWVRQHYPGIDDAQRMRNFIKEAMEKWGVVYVLLGGDVPEIPTRWIWMTPLYTPWPVHIVTDLYFSDLDGDWNHDGDEKFGEIEDSLDLYPDVFVGRLPADSYDEMLYYLQKIEEYQRPSIVDYQNKTLFFTSDLYESGDARQIAERLDDHFPTWFSRSIINEVPLTQLDDSIHAGFGIITGVGHGDVNHIRVRNTPRENATNFFFDSLHNTNRYAVMFTITCLTNTYQSDCLSKHWLFDPDGGGIGYIGPTSSSEGLLHEDYTAVQFDSLFAAPLAAVLAIAKIPFIPDAQWDNYYRLYQFSINLMGDPALTLWDSLPLNYSTILTPDTINIGIETVTITLDPPVTSSVVFYKENEIFRIDTVTAGSSSFEVKTGSAGYLKYTIRDIPPANRACRFVPYIDSICILPARPYLVHDSIQIQDTSGNSNGTINPGEHILLYLSLENTGSAAAESVSAWITCTDSLINMLVDTASYDSIIAGNTAKNLTPFCFDVSNSMPDEHALNFQVTVDYSGTSGIDSFQIIGLASELVHFTQEYVTAGDTFSINPYLANYGHEAADSVYAVISPLSDSMTIIDSIVTFPVIASDSIVASGPDLLEFYLNYAGADACYNFRVYEGALEVMNVNIELNALPSPGSIRVLGMNKKIALEWTPVTGSAGYYVYRSSQSAGPYVYLKTLLDNTCLFEDHDIIPDADYFYYVAAIDSSMNRGAPSDTVCGRANPLYASGWPRTVYDYLFSSCNFGDIDPYYPGTEIVVCGKEGNIYAWHCDGSAVDSSGDSRILDISPAEVWTSPAIGDANADGALEIAFGVRRTTNNLYLIDFQGNPMANWPISIPGNIIGSPVFSDIDRDDSLEILIWTLEADLYALRHDGTGLYSPGGLLYNGPGIGFGTPAVGDLNNDENLEIVCCGGSNSDSLYVWDRFGDRLPPFPVYIQTGGLTYAVTMGDIIGDECLEIAFYADNSDRVYLVSADGSILWSEILGKVADIEGSPVFADITGDSQPELICGYQSGFTVFDSLGNILPGYPDLNHDAKLPIVIDADGDYDMDMVVGSVDWNLYAYQNNGSQAKGFPILFNNRIESCPAAHDIDLDGDLELMIGAYGYHFYVFDLMGTLTAWPKFRFDQYNTGTLGPGTFPGVIKKPDTIFKTGFGLWIYPNPFSRTADIKIQTNNNAHKEPISLKIYDVSGRLVRSFSLPASDFLLPGYINWSGDDDKGRAVAPGVYFIKLQMGDARRIVKIVKIK